jgi:hypothetical protein
MDRKRPAFVSLRPLRLVALGVTLWLAGACAEPDTGDAGSIESTPALGPADGADLPGMDLDRIQVGDVAPDFTLAAFDGSPVTLSDFRGDTNVLLVFYRGHW